MDPTLLSTKKIDSRDRLIVALDVPSVEKAKALVELLGESVSFYKIGLQLFMAGDYFSLLSWLAARQKNVFVDLKFFDVPETVRLAVEQLADRGAMFATIHGNEAIVRAAASAKGSLKILGVTVLTSLDEGDLRDLGFECNVEQLVLSRARRAIQSGADGVISSGLEAEQLRRAYGDEFIIVSPGIRPVSNQLVKDDQKRVVELEDAFRKGADYVVVGRPIRNAPDPKAAAEAHQQRIAAVFQ